jgi:hypothetical protein
MTETGNDFVVHLSKILFFVKCVISSLFVALSAAYIISGIGEGYCRLDIPRLVNGMLLVLSIIVLGYFESGQVAVVNISAIDDKQTLQLKDSHPRTYAIYQYVKPIGIVEKYLIGRQLCVIAIVFLISYLSTYPNMPYVLPTYLQHVLITSGLPGVLLTLNFGQIFPQLIAYEYTIRFLDIYGTLSAIKFSASVEAIGVFTNFSWIVTKFVSTVCPEWESDSKYRTENLTNSTHNLTDSSEHSVSDDNIISTEAINIITTNTVHELSSLVYHIFNGSIDTIIKNIISILLCILALVFILYGMYKEYTILQLPYIVLFILFIFVLICIFYLEGLQVAVLSIPSQYSMNNVHIYSNTQSIHELLTSNGGQHVKKFLMGRQFLVVLAMFTMASLTTYQTDAYHQNILPTKVFGLFVLSGFSGILFTLNAVQMPSQMLAKQNPMKFLNLPGILYIIKFCIFVESIGITHFGWILFFGSKYIFF